MVRRIVSYAAVAACVVAMTAGVMAQTPSATAFSYQGRLTDAGQPGNGVYDLQFALFDSASGGAVVGAPVVVDDVTVSGGLFTVMLDFGAVFSGPTRWIEIAVRHGASSGAFTTLGARQPITAAPQALFSLSSQTSQSSQTSVSSTTSASTPWSGLTGVPAGFADGVDNDTLGALTCGLNQIPKSNGLGVWACALDNDNSNTQWNLTGNAGTGGNAILGTTDLQPFELRANNQRALRIVPAPTARQFADAPQMIGGFSGNVVNASALGITIAGGGRFLATNAVIADYGTVGGGVGNTSSDHATVGGGNNNSATGTNSTISGGNNNLASGNASTVAGGDNNQATGTDATAVGGNGNRATGDYSFAAGFNTNANGTGSFVWGDNADGSTIAAGGDNRFVVAASGGIWFGTRAAGSPGSFNGKFILTSTGASLTTAGVWTNASDRNLKEHFEPVDGRALLDTLARLPVTRWNYKTERGVQHIGPTAQDFQAAFGVGGDDKTITTLDPAGIALRAIQQLDRENHELRDALDAQARELAELKAQVASLKTSRKPRGSR